ncbi:MAG: hypothetical protein U0235_31665 [Polyangiaceae bacterium]
MTQRFDVLRELFVSGSRNFRAAEAEIRSLLATSGDAPLLVSDEVLSLLGAPVTPTEEPSSPLPTSLNLLRG